MEIVFGLFIICLAIAIVVLPFVATVRAGKALRLIQELNGRVKALEKEIQSLKQRSPGEAAATPKLVATREETVTPVATAGSVVVPEPIAKAPVAAIEQAASVSAPAPPLPPPLPPTGGPAKPSIPFTPVRQIEKAETAAKPPVDWEQFIGAKLFAWIAGLALFLGVAFFVKYSFDHNLIPPEVRVAIGFLVGIGLVGGGVAMTRKATAVTAQTLCATGVLVLYAVTFACRALYHFPFFGVGPTFALMALLTATAFLLAVRLDALVVAVLGIAGGFLTPLLLSTGQDAPIALFSYIALLDIGLLAVAMRKGWRSLPILGAAGTVLMQLAWTDAYFDKGKYFDGGKTLLAMAIFVVFQALFLAAAVLAKKLGKPYRTLVGTALSLGLVALLLGLSFLVYPHIANRPALLFGYVLIVNLGILALVILDDAIRLAQPFTGLISFGFLALWTGGYLVSGNLNTALAGYFVFALLHSVTPIVLQRLHARKLSAWSHAFPALALLLVLMPIFQIPALSFLIWPFVLVVDLLAIVLAVLTATLLPILIVLALTLVTLGALICKIPSELTGLPTALFLVGGFAVFFLVAALWACRKLSPGARAHTPSIFGRIDDPANLAAQLPALSAALPFLLLIMVTVRLPLTNPSPVFGLALALAVLLLGLAKIMSLDALPAVGLACVLGLEHAWHFSHFQSGHAVAPLGWNLAFYALFTAFPFLFHRQFNKKSAPWAVAALAGPLHFYLVLQIVGAAYPAFHGVMGLLPALFALPALLGLVALLRRGPAENPARNAQLAWFGGVALFFITLVFPIQFDRQWITIGWALEGAALCWLFRRVPHPGLRLTGIGLLIISFARLALNPAVLEYHPRTAVAIFNWYLYAYGLTAVAAFAGARLLAGRNQSFPRPASAVLAGIGTVLAFLLVNIEIADYFTAPGAAVLTFDLSANLARDMSYSIAWALFALLLLVIGIRQKLAPVRYASLALLGVTVLKLFLHDLSALDQLYRIGAFIAVAIIAIVASYLYQRFVVLAEKSNEIPAPPPPAE